MARPTSASAARRVTRGRAAKPNGAVTSAPVAPDPELRRAVRAGRLRYTSDTAPGYRRVGAPGRFRYVNARGRPLRQPAELQRIKSLAIPPAWTDVWISAQRRGHLQASGRDARGRKQYLYHADWRAVRDRTKFDSLVQFADALPRLRRAVVGALRRPALDRDKVIAVVVRLLDWSLIRVGNDEYARTNRSYGLTTLQTRHARVRGPRIQFVFPGKSGVRHRIELQDRMLARVVREIQELPGQELFQFLDATGRRHRLHSNDINAFIREATGADFTAKDFRTWAATVLAGVILAALPTPATAGDAKRAATLTAEVVAQRLGNTPAICRKSYIHPVVFEAHAAGTLQNIPAPSVPDLMFRPRIRLSPEERAIRAFLRRRRRTVPVVRAAAGSRAAAS